MDELQATDGTRALVKMQVAEFTGKLTGLPSGEQLGSTSHRDPQVGFSTELPHSHLG